MSEQLPILPEDNMQPANVSPEVFIDAETLFAEHVAKTRAYGDALDASPFKGIAGFAKQVVSPMLVAGSTVSLFTNYPVTTLTVYASVASGIMYTGFRSKSAHRSAHERLNEAAQEATGQRYELFRTDDKSVVLRWHGPSGDVPREAHEELRYIVDLADTQGIKEVIVGDAMLRSIDPKLAASELTTQEWLHKTKHIPTEGHSETDAIHLLTPAELRRIAATQKPRTAEVLADDQIRAIIKKLEVLMPDHPLVRTAHDFAADVGLMCAHLKRVSASAIERKIQGVETFANTPGYGYGSAHAMIAAKSVQGDPGKKIVLKAPPLDEVRKEVVSYTDQKRVKWTVDNRPSSSEYSHLVYDQKVDAPQGKQTSHHTPRKSHAALTGQVMSDGRVAIIANGQLQRITRAFELLEISSLDVEVLLENPESNPNKAITLLECMLFEHLHGKDDVRQVPLGELSEGETGDTFSAKYIPLIQERMGACGTRNIQETITTQKYTRQRIAAATMATVLLGFATITGERAADAFYDNVSNLAEQDMTAEGVRLPKVKSEKEEVIQQEISKNSPTLAAWGDIKHIRDSIKDVLGDTPESSAEAQSNNYVEWRLTTQGSKNAKSLRLAGHWRQYTSNWLELDRHSGAGWRKRQVEYTNAFPVETSLPDEVRAIKVTRRLAYEDLTYKPHLNGYIVSVPVRDRTMIRAANIDGKPLRVMIQPDHTEVLVVDESMRDYWNKGQGQGDLSYWLQATQSSLGSAVAVDALEVVGDLAPTPRDVADAWSKRISNIPASREERARQAAIFIQQRFGYSLAGMPTPQELKDVPDAATLPEWTFRRGRANCEWASMAAAMTSSDAFVANVSGFLNEANSEDKVNVNPNVLSSREFHAWLADTRGEFDGTPGPKTPAEADELSSFFSEAGVAAQPPATSVNKRRDGESDGIQTWQIWSLLAIGGMSIAVAGQRRRLADVRAKWAYKQLQSTDLETLKQTIAATNYALYAKPSTELPQVETKVRLVAEGIEGDKETLIERLIHPGKNQTDINSEHVMKTLGDLGALGAQETLLTARRTARNAVWARDRLPKKRQ